MSIFDGGSSCCWIICLACAVLSVYVGVYMQNIDAILQIDELIDSLDNSIAFNMFDNRALKNNFAPTSIENVNVNAPLISGTLPSDLEGLFVRVGPNPIPEHIGKKRYHWFDGHGMIHSIRIVGSTISYSNQFVKTPRYTIERDRGKSIFLMIGEMQGPIGVLKMLWNMISRKEKLLGQTPLTVGTANTAIVHYFDKILVCHEASLPFSIAWNENNSFDSVGFDNMHGGLHVAMTAHPKVDPRDGNMYFVSYSAGHADPSITYGSVRDDYVLSFTSLQLPESPWIHDMMITTHYILVLQSSVGFSLKNMWRRGEGLFQYDPRQPFRVGVARKDGGAVRVSSSHGSDMFQSDIMQWFEAVGPAVIVHAANAWEEGDKIILWAPMADAFDGTLQSGTNRFVMSCITLDLQTGRMSRGTLAREYNVEFPRVHPDCVGVSCRYAFASIQGEAGLEGEFVGFLKFDLKDRKVTQVVMYPPDLVAGEMVPIVKQKASAAPGGDHSDHLYLASFFFDKKFNGSEWRVYDGQSMASEPITRVRVPGRVPHGFHGEWISEHDLQTHIASAKK